MFVNIMKRFFNLPVLNKVKQPIKECLLKYGLFPHAPCDMETPSQDSVPEITREPTIIRVSRASHEEILYDNVRIPQLTSKKPAPNTIPNEFYNDFTLNGQIPCQYLFYDASSGCLAPHNTATNYDEAFNQFENKTFKYDTYQNEIEEFYDAFDMYSIQGKTILIWGLAGLNIEALSVWKGAERVYVVDYNKPICEHEKITVLTHDELKESGLKTDFAVSFSSFEHDGLGQYGDPINPFGDLQAMQQAKFYLKENGILFLGVPTSQDCLVWNAHRIYGELRLPILLKGWACLDVFNVYGDVTPDFPFDMPLGALVQPLLVLENIATDYPSDEWFEKELNNDIKSTSFASHAPRIKKRIITICNNHRNLLNKK